MGKTTIQLSEQTKAELDNLKKGDMESYDATLQRIIRNHNTGADIDADTVREIAREVVRDSVVAEALE